MLSMSFYAYRTLAEYSSGASNIIKEVPGFHDGEETIRVLNCSSDVHDQSLVDIVPESPPHESPQGIITRNKGRIQSQSKHFLFYNL